MRMPNTDAINVAVAWLNSNEGDGEEATRCKAVAEWIEHEERERMIRSVARSTGVTAAVIRRKLLARAVGDRTRAATPQT